MIPTCRTCERLPSAGGVVRAAFLVACMLAPGAGLAADLAGQAEGGEQAAAAGRGERPGLIRLGGFYLTPYLRIGTLGLDTNVFYTPTERRTDFTASGGPGLEVVRPLGNRSRLRLDGGLDYVYFARTESQRRLNGYGSGLIDIRGVKTDLAVEGRWGRAYGRPNAEVNERVQQETVGGRLFLRRSLSERFALALSGGAQRVETETTEYLGADLGSTLTQDRALAGGELRMALSIKTQLVAGGDQSWYRFPRAAERNGRSTLAYGGLRTDATALIGGQALAGMRWFALHSGGRREALYVNVDATWNISPKTRLGGAYSRDINYSSFDTSGATPTNRVETAEVFLDKVLVRGLYLRLFGRIQLLTSDGEITVAETGDLVTAVRDDDVREAGGELGWQFRTRLRIGVRASYAERASPFTTFGVRGLLAGLTVQYNPPQPSFR